MCICMHYIYIYCADINSFNDSWPRGQAGRQLQKKRNETQTHINNKSKNKKNSNGPGWGCQGGTVIMKKNRAPEKSKKTNAY